MGDNHTSRACCKYANAGSSRRCATVSSSTWIQVHIHALEFYGGAPTLIVPDNTKTAVTRACRYDPDLNPTYQEFAVYYGVGVVPARPYRPRDLAGVLESAAQAPRSGRGLVGDIAGDVVRGIWHSYPNAGIKGRDADRKASTRAGGFDQGETGKDKM